jgi:predicted transcriptional regulator
MTVQPKSRQGGISFLGLVFVGAVLAITGVVAAQVFPTFVEYQAIDKAAQKASGGNSVAEVRVIFDRAIEVDNITSIKSKDLDVTKDGEKIFVKFAYEREIHLVGPAFLTLKYSGRSR